MTTATDQPDRGEQQLDQLCAAVLHDPEHAVTHVTRQLSQPGNDPRTQTDLLILLAETNQRLRRHHLAQAATTDAAYAARLLPDGQRGTVVVGVAADVAVWAGHAQAVEACTAYLHAAFHDDPPRVRRIALARALLAVAIFHQRSCEEGRSELAMLQQSNTGDDDPTATMLAAGLAAMQDGCRPFCQQAPVSPLPPMPGGVLHPGLEFPAADYLARRIRLHPARHTCDFRAR